MKKLLFALSLLVFVFSAFETVSAADWLVTKSTNSNDGVCNADCSLREAVGAADSGDTVIFQNSLIGQTFTLGGSAIVITKRITIDGNIDGVNVAFISGSNTSRIFTIQPGAGLDLKNAILVQGNGKPTENDPAFSEGGAIYALNASLSLERVAVRGNSAIFSGAIHLFGGTHRFVNCSFTGNQAESNTALGVLNASLYMSNATVSNNNYIDGDNSAGGAIVLQGGNLIVRNSTITNNSGELGGGIAHLPANPSSLDIGNTIVAGNTATLNGQDIYRAVGLTITSRGGNLIQNTQTVPAGTFTQTNDETGVNPLLAPTNANQGGHPIATHPLQAGSPAIGTGLNALAVEPLSNLPLTTDARGAGFPRISGGTVDKGAFEDQSNGASLVVTKLANSNDNVCDTDCSLREAVFAAGADPGTDNINFAANVFGTLDLGGSEILIQNNNVNIIGYPTLSAETLIVSGNNTNRILRINNSAVSITGMTFANGNGVSGVSNGFGGAIYAQSNSNLTLERVIVRNNSANFYGALYLLGGTHRIINTTINNNQATGCIAIGNVNSATLNMANVTLSTNLDSNGGTGAGALCNIDSTANIRNSTIAFNRIGSDPGAGIWSSGTLNIGNTIVAGNIAGSNPDINNASGTINSLGGNLVQDVNGLPFSALNGTNDQTGIDPLLNALANNGGNVPTLALMPNSPAINTGLNANAADPFDNAPLATDARGSGFMRIVSIVDKGAFETLIPTAAAVSISGKVFDGEGNPASKAKVYMTGSNGITRTASTNNFGNFTFEDVSAGETYILNVYAKKWQFNPQIVNVSEDIKDLTFTPQQ